MKAPHVIHLGLTLTTHLSMVPAWLESWWSTPPPEAWDITHANSFHRANPTAMLMWIFTAWRHDVILGLLAFAVLTGILVFAFLLFSTIRWIWSSLAHLCNKGGAAGSPGIKDADINEVTEDSKNIAHSDTHANPLVVTPEDPQSPNHPASLIENIAPLPSIEAPSIPALEWQESTTGAIVRITSRSSRRLRSNSVPRRP